MNACTGFGAAGAGAEAVAGVGTFGGGGGGAGAGDGGLAGVATHVARLPAPLPVLNAASPPPLLGLAVGPFAGASAREAATAGRLACIG